MIREGECVSFVSVVATEGFVTVMSDGRVSGLDILVEDYQKFVLSTDKNFFIAYAGDRTLCEIVANKILESYNVKMPFDTIKEQMIGCAQRNFDDQTNIMLSFGGVNYNGQIEVIGCDLKTKECLYYRPVGDKISYLFHSNLPPSMKEEMGDRFVETLRETGTDSPTSIIQAQKLLNNHVSTIDDSVNRKTFRACIKRE